MLELACSCPPCEHELVALNVSNMEDHKIGVPKSLNIYTTFPIQRTSKTTLKLKNKTTYLRFKRRKSGAQLAPLEKQ